MAIFSVNAGSSMSHEVIVWQYYLIWDVCRSFSILPTHNFCLLQNHTVLLAV